MTNGNKSPNQRTDEKLVRVFPAETQFDPKDKSGRKVLMQRCWEADKFGRFFPSTLTTQQLLDAVAKTKVKLPNLEILEESDFIVYQYKGRPLISLNRKDGQFCCAASDIEEFGREAVQHQAHIVVNILKTHGLSGAVIGKPVYSSSARNVLGGLKTYK
jgi:hypothetical protein